MIIHEPRVGIGVEGSGGLFYQRTRQLRDGGLPPFGESRPSWLGSQYEGYVAVRNTSGTPGDDIVVTYGGQSETSGAVGSGAVSASGAKLEFVGGKYLQTMADGTKVTFDTAMASPVPFWANFHATVMTYGWTETARSLNAWITKVERPDGEVINWHYLETPAAIPGFAGQKGFRLQSVTNNLGYQIHFKYKSDTALTASQGADWHTLEKVTAIDNAVYACAALAVSCDQDGGGTPWPYLTYGVETSGTVYTVTDRLNQKTRYVYTLVFGTPGFSYLQELTAVTSPANPASDITIARTGADPTSTSGTLTLTAATGVWNYSYTWAAPHAQSTIISGPNGYSRSMARAGPPAAAVPLVTSDTVNGYTMTFLYDGLGRTTQVNYPDGRYSVYSYDARRNVTHLRQVAKAGSGLADIHSYATYPEATNSICVNAKTCNKPLTHTDPRGFTTTYTWDASHGGILTETKPAPGSGPYAAIQPQKRYTYGTVSGIIRQASVSSCRTTASCGGLADETIIETTYNAKRLPSSIVMRAGDSSISSTIATTYTAQGDVESVDGPLSGSADTAWKFYDVMRQPRASVAPDPDGAGGLTYRAVRTTYDADGQPTMVEQGGVAAPSDCNRANAFCTIAGHTLTVLAKSTVEYDTFGRTKRENVINVATGAIEAVTQYEYGASNDTGAAGQLKCVAKRMNPNPAVYGALPAACTLSTTGSFGADQIVRTTYNADGKPTVVQSGYGTTLVRNERIYGYYADGSLGGERDAANNLTTLEYDGFNRLNKIRYPLPTVGSMGSSTTDYELFVFDGAGNKTSERRRDGLIVANTYDALNRLRLIDKPGAELDVTNSYDSLDHLITATQTGSSVSWAYDALGRVTSEAQGLGTVSYLYDAAGRRTRLTYPEFGFFVNYQYFGDGKLNLLGLNGATTGAGVLATYYDDQLGRRTSMCRGTGAISSCASVARTAYSYDAISRLTGLSHDLVTGGATNDASWTLAYSPASQLTSRSASSALYEWPYSATFTDAYAVNGLNQYTTVAGASLAYDGRGNTTNDTTKTYVYDSSNMLTSASNGAVLAYDPTGRLLSIAQGGVTTKFLYDGTRLIAEYNGSNSLLRRYVHGDGVDDPIVWYDSSGTTNKRDLFKDERGSVIAADSGAAVTSLKYDEYGNATVTGSTSPRFQYTGQVWLPELGINYYKARIYNPDLGRFMQTDPIGTKDQMNLYAYVGNDPMGRSDPTGLSCEKDDQTGQVSSCSVDEGREQMIRDTSLAGVEAFEAAMVTVAQKLLDAGSEKYLINVGRGDSGQTTAGAVGDRLVNAHVNYTGQKGGPDGTAPAHTDISKNEITLYTGVKDVMNGTARMEGVSDNYMFNRGLRDRGMTPEGNKMMVLMGHEATHLVRRMDLLTGASSNPNWLLDHQFPYNDKVEGFILRKEK